MVAVVVVRPASSKIVNKRSVRSCRFEYVEYTSENEVIDGRACKLETIYSPDACTKVKGFVFENQDIYYPYQVIGEYSFGPQWDFADNRIGESTPLDLDFFCGHRHLSIR